MKKITAALLTCTLAITNNSCGMEHEETISKQNRKLEKIEKRQLQEKNNALLQENNKLLKDIQRQNKVIISQNHISFEHEIILVETHRSLAYGKSEKKAEFTYRDMMRKLYEDETKYDKI